MSESQIPEHPELTYSHGAIVRGDLTLPRIHLMFTGHDYNDGGTIIRATLKEQQVQAHFFFTGDFYRNTENSELIKGLKDEGHYLGAHSDQHLLYAPWHDRDSLRISRDEFMVDLKHNYDEMAKIGIRKPDATLFMPPYEWYNEKIAKWTREFGLTLINYSPGTRSHADYTTPDMGTRYMGSQVLFDKILDYESSSENGMNGFILLIHLGTHPNRTDKLYNRLDDLIETLKQRGYEFTLMSF